jgi:hypothetical protein
MAYFYYNIHYYNIHLYYIKSTLTLARLGRLCVYMKYSRRGCWEGCVLESARGGSCHTVMADKHGI